MNRKHDPFYSEFPEPETFSWRYDSDFSPSEAEEESDRDQFQHILALSPTPCPECLLASAMDNLDQTAFAVDLLEEFK